MVGQRVTLELTVEVESISMEHLESDVIAVKVLRKVGGGGLDPVIEDSVRQLKIITHGTHG